MVFQIGSEFEREDVHFIINAECQDYDWLVMYDDMTRSNVGTVRREREPLACPPEQTILVTAEPPNIKIYPKSFTRQFGYVLTTHDSLYLPHRNYRLGRGCLQWFVDYTPEQVYGLPEWPKSKLISTVCSSKQMKHTRHFDRFRLTRYVADHLPDLDWYGHGVKWIDSKQTALNDYKYHIAVENYIHAHHWSDKLSDPLLALCLTFYAGDPVLDEILPPECVVPIPVDDPAAALEIINKTIRDREYEKRLPALREARRLIVNRYNLFDQVVQLIHEHVQNQPVSPPREKPYVICGRHRVRRNPLNALSELVQLVHFRVLQKVR